MLFFHLCAVLFIVVLLANGYNIWSKRSQKSFTLVEAATSLELQILVYLSLSMTLRYLFFAWHSPQLANIVTAAGFPLIEAIHLVESHMYERVHLIAMAPAQANLVLRHSRTVLINLYLLYHGIYMIFPILANLSSLLFDVDGGFFFYNFVINIPNFFVPVVLTFISYNTWKVGRSFVAFIDEAKRLGSVPDTSIVPQVLAHFSLHCWVTLIIGMTSSLFGIYALYTNFEFPHLFYFLCRWIFPIELTRVSIATFVILKRMYSAPWQPSFMEDISVVNNTLNDNSDVEIKQLRGRYYHHLPDHEDESDGSDYAPDISLDETRMKIAGVVSHKDQDDDWSWHFMPLAIVWTCCSGIYADMTRSVTPAVSGRTDSYFDEVGLLLEEVQRKKKKERAKSMAPTIFSDGSSRVLSVTAEKTVDTTSTESSTEEVPLEPILLGPVRYHPVIPAVSPVASPSNSVHHSTSSSTSEPSSPSQSKENCRPHSEGIHSIRRRAPTSVNVSLTNDEFCIVVDE